MELHFNARIERKLPNFPESWRKKKTGGKEREGERRRGGGAGVKLRVRLSRDEGGPSTIRSHFNESLPFLRINEHVP